MYAQIVCVYVGSDMNELKDFGYLFMWSIVIIGFIGIVISHIKENSYQAGYWSGRSAGWKSCIEHQSKISQMKMDQVFDYDKN